MRASASEDHTTVGRSAPDQDEAELKAKRRRLKAFASAIDEARRASNSAAKLAEELVNAGDLSRADLARVFKLSKAERSALTPARRTSDADAPVQASDAAPDESSEGDQAYEDAA
ncbi:hypothetical protein ACI3KS_12315 [Microbacterium sp. ZW T5_45]|uniref:hypothetical protein n=1 Tax=Microbacterium sp. ZW T5_45 TaxID=3378080 RepID=UPI003852E4BD